jgi:hypothetical protein
MQTQILTLPLPQPGVGLLGVYIVIKNFQRACIVYLKQ